MTALPAGWDTAPLGSVLSVKYGKALSQGDRLPLEVGTFPVVGSAGPLASSSKPLASQPVIVVGRKGNVGSIQLFQSGCWPIDTTYYFEIPEALSPRFLAHQLISLDLVRLDSSTATPSLRREDLESQVIAIPPRQVQERTVNLLDDLLSRLDAADGYSMAAQARTRNLQHSIWARVFSRLEQRHGLSRLLDVATIANGQTPKGLGERLETVPQDGLVPYFKVGDMNTGDGRYMSASRFFVSAQDAAELGLHIRQAGTVLIPKRGGAIATNKKRILAAPAAIDLNTMGLVPADRLVPEYLWHWLAGIDLGAIADGSNVPQINSPQIRKLALPLPPIDEQRQTVDTLNELAEQTNRFKTVLNQNLTRGAQLRRSLLRATFRGDLSGEAVVLAGIGGTGDV